MTELQDADVGIRRFAKLSPDSVNHCAQNLGVQTSRDVSYALVDDVSFRIRQVTDVSACTYTYRQEQFITSQDMHVLASICYISVHSYTGDIVLSRTNTVRTRIV